MRRSIDLKGSILSSITVGERELVMSFVRAMVVERPSDQSGGPAVRSTRRLDLKIMKPGLTTVLNRVFPRCHPGTCGGLSPPNAALLSAR